MGYTEAIANLQLLTSHASAMLESTCLVSSALSRKIPLRSLPRSRILGTDRPAARLDHFRVALVLNRTRVFGRAVKVGM